MSKLLRFGYLRFRRLAVLVLILSLVSTLFLMTAMCFLGFYRSFNSYLGEEEGVVAVYDRQSRTPFTGSIPAYLSEQVSQVNGVLVSSPETITPCIVANQSVFVRGVLPEMFFQLNPAQVVDGKVLNSSDLGSVMLGKNLADRLNLQVGDGVLVFSTLADRYLELKVVGVYVSGSGMDDEALVLLNVGQWLRFSDYNHVTLIRAKTGSDLSAVGLYKELAQKVQNQTIKPVASNSSSRYVDYQSIISWAPISFKIDQLSVSGTQNLLKSYLDRYGVTREALSILSVLVFLLCSLTVILATQTMMRQHKDEVETLRYVGASKWAIRVDVLFKLLPLSLLACCLGAVLSFVLLSVFGGYGFLRVLGHSLVLSFDPSVLVLNFVLVLGLVTLGVFRQGLNE